MVEQAIHPTREANAGEQPSLAGPLLVWLWIASTFAQFRTREVDDLWGMSAVDGQVLYQLGSWLLLGLLAVKLLLSGRTDLRLLRGGPLFWYGCYAIMALLSALYAPSLGLTAYRALQLGVALVLVLSLGPHQRSLHAFAIVYVAVNWALFLVGAVVSSDSLAWVRGPENEYAVLGGSLIDGPWRFASAFGHPSQISIVAAVGAIYLAARQPGPRWRLRGPLIAWLVLTTLLTVSRTAIAGMVGGLLVVVVGRRLSLPVLVLAGIVGPLLLMSPELNERSLKFLMRGQTASEFQSLTGRDSIYQEAMRRADDSWLGLGFKSGRKELLVEDETGAKITHSHNLFLESFVGMGLPGLLLAALVVLSTACGLWRLLRRPAPADPQRLAGWQVLALLTPLAAFSVMDLGFAAEANAVVMLFLLVFSLVQTELLAGSASARLATRGQAASLSRLDVRPFPTA